MWKLRKFLLLVLILAQSLSLSLCFWIRTLHPLPPPISFLVSWDLTNIDIQFYEYLTTYIYILQLSPTTLLDPSFWIRFVSNLLSMAHSLILRFIMQVHQRNIVSNPSMKCKSKTMFSFFKWISTGQFTGNSTKDSNQQSVLRVSRAHVDVVWYRWIQQLSTRGLRLLQLLVQQTHKSHDPYSFYDVIFIFITGLFTVILFTILFCMCFMKKRHIGQELGYRLGNNIQLHLML